MTKRKSVKAENWNSVFLDFGADYNIVTSISHASMLFSKLTAVCESHRTVAGAVYVIQLIFCLEALTADILPKHSLGAVKFNLPWHTPANIYRHFL